MLSFRLMFPRRIVVSVLLLAGTSFSALAQPSGRMAPPRNAGFVLGDAKFEALPLERSPQNHLIVRAYINGKPARLGVDTGAPVSAIATRRRDYFGLNEVPGTSKLPARLMINGAFSSVGIAKSLRLGALNLIDEPMVAIDLGSKKRHTRLRGDQEIDGILGADILFPTRAVLDCQQQLLILNMEPQSQAATPGVDLRGLKSVPIHVSEGYNLYVDGAINGKPAQLMVDTGAFATLLHRSFVKRMKIPLYDTPFASSAINLRERGVQVARIRRLSIGSMSFSERAVGVIDLDDLIQGGMLNGDRPVAGLLGGELLRRQHGIIDFGTRRLYLKG